MAGISGTGGMMGLGAIVSLVNRVSGPAMKMAADTRAMRRSLSAADADTVAWGKSLQKTGQHLMKTGAIAAAAGGVILGALGGLAQPAADLDTALAKVRTTYTGMGEDGTRWLNELRESALGWSKVHSDTATEYIETSYIMRGAGLDMVASVAGTEAALRLSKGTFGDTAASAGLLAMLYSNVADKTKPVSEEMNRLSDILAVTQTRFQFENLDVLTTGMEYVASATATMNANIADAAVFIGVLNTRGIQGERAGTGLRNIMLRTDKVFTDLGLSVPRLSDGTLDMVGILDMLSGRFDINTQSGRAMLTELYGLETMPALAALIGEGGDSLRRMSGEMDSLRGAAGRMQEAAEATFGERWQQLKNNVTAMAISIGEALMPHLERLFGWLQNVVRGVEAWATRNPELASTITGIATAIGTILAVGGPLIALWGAVKWVVGGAVTIFVAVKNAMLLFRVQYAALFVWQKLVAAAQWLVNASFMGFPLVWIIAAVVAVIAAVVLLVEYWDEVVAALGAAWNWIKNGIASLAQAVTDGLQWIWDKITGVFTDIWSWITGLGTKFYNAGRDLVVAIGDGISDAFDWLWDQVVGLFTPIAENLFPHSDAKEGPFSRLTKAGEAIPRTMAKGVGDGRPFLLQQVLAMAEQTGVSLREGLERAGVGSWMSGVLGRANTLRGVTDRVASIYESSGLMGGAMAGMMARARVNARFNPRPAAGGVGTGLDDGFSDGFTDDFTGGGGGGGSAAAKDRAGVRVFQLGEGAINITVNATDPAEAGRRVRDELDAYFRDEAAAQGAF